MSKTYSYASPFLFEAWRVRTNEADRETCRITLALSTVTGGFGLAYLRSNIIVPGDPAAPAGNIHASEFWFRAAFAGILFGQVFMFFAGLTLFHLFREVNRRMATVLLASGFRLARSVESQPSSGC